MSYKVIVDSCGELTPDMKKAGNIFTASLTLNVGGHLVVDDETFDQADFLARVARCSECPKSSPRRRRAGTRRRSRSGRACRRRRR